MISIIFLFISFLALNVATYLSLIRFMKLQTNRVLDFNDKLCFVVTSFLLSFSMGIFLASLLVHNKSLELTLNERLLEIESRPLIMKLVDETGDGPMMHPRDVGYIPWAMRPYGSVSVSERYRNAGTDKVIAPPSSVSGSGVSWGSSFSEPGVYSKGSLEKIKGYFRRDS